MREIMFIAHIPEKKPYPKVAEDGKILTNISPYYMYTCINTKCGCCGWIERWVSKVDKHKCSSCGKVMVRIANPKQIDEERYCDEADSG